MKLGEDDPSLVGNAAAPAAAQSTVGPNAVGHEDQAPGTFAIEDPEYELEEQYPGGGTGSS